MDGFPHEAINRTVINSKINLPYINKSKDESKWTDCIDDEHKTMLIEFLKDDFNMWNKLKEQKRSVK